MYVFAFLISGVDICMSSGTVWKILHMIVDLKRLKGNPLEFPDQFGSKGTSFVCNFGQTNYILSMLSCRYIL